MSILYASFYAGPGYAAEACGLVASLDAFGLAHEVRELPDAGSWELNCGRKAAYLLGLRREFPDCPLVWVDADARIVRRPTLFDSLSCDVAAHWKDGEELLSGTLYFGDTDGAEDLLQAWASECSRRPTEWDQRVLSDILEGSRRWRVSTLPAEYVRIFDADGMGEAVIVHGQASRRLKR